MENKPKVILDGVMEKMLGLDKRCEEIESQRRTLLSDQAEAHRVFSAQERIFSRKIEEAIASRNLRGEKALQEDLIKIKNEYETETGKREQQQISLSQEMENLKSQKVELVSEAARKFYLGMREEYYKLLSDVADLRDSIQEELMSLARNTGVELPIEHFRDGLRISDHAPETMWGGNRVLFKHLQGLLVQ
jgi:hypothetical protein